jgi:sec-independent protein translocase protein TatA
MGLDNPLHIALLILFLLLLFGAKRLPGMARDLGSGLREFKEGVLHGSPAETSSTIQPSAPVVTQTPQQAQPAAESAPAPAPQQNL